MKRSSLFTTSLFVAAVVAAISMPTACGGGGGGGGGGGPGSSKDAGSGGLSGAGAKVTCEPSPEEFFEVELPLLTGNLPYPAGWVTDHAWPPAANPSTKNPTSDTILIPNGRPVYALIVSGYETNRYMDDLLVYKFATHLMEQGAYVHFAWWNNLLAPYMERPLHHNDSYPGDLQNDFFKFAGLTAPSGGVQRKAYPAEDFQFVADARRLLTAIRKHNPSAMIVLVGHSMGGGAVVHLARETEVTIDLLAPIDPVNNRNYPWGGRTIDNNEEYFNWTRWRVTRDAFQGFKDTKLTLTQPFPPVFECLPQGDYVPSVDEVSGCSLYYDKDGVATIAPRIINLHHTWQTEAKFPFDYDRAYKFTYTPPPGGTAYQKEVAGILSDPVFGTQADPGGWPYGPLQSGYDDQCCPDPGDPGIAWDDDGHGEIVGFRGPVSGDLLSVVWLNAPIPLGVRVRTTSWAIRAHHCGCSLARSRCCCSSSAAISRACCCPVARNGRRKSRCGTPSARQDAP
jgi:hypothetical protein